MASIAADRICGYENCTRQPPVGTITMRCGRCRSVYYCSKECQGKDWSRHQPECGKADQVFKQTVITASTERKDNSPRLGNAERIEAVQEKLRTELFVRLPRELKEELLKEIRAGSLSEEQFALLQAPPGSWKNIDVVRKTAIRACLEGRISERDLGFYMVFGMAHEMKEKLPRVQFLCSFDQNESTRERLVKTFCSEFNIPPQLLGDPSRREDALFFVQMEPGLDPTQPYHYTAELSRTTNPFAITDPRTGQTKHFVFLPHVYERILAYLHPEFPEKPLYAIGTKRIEKFSDPTQRVLSMTGGTTVPTPNIEANEALSLMFYLHDLYHLETDSAIGRDRIFWNAFGKHLLEVAKRAPDPDLKEAFQALAEFCLDKEFSYYKLFPKNTAFLLPLIGLNQIVGKHQVDDQEIPFQLIRDEAFADRVRTLLFHQFTIFWNKHAPNLTLRADLTKEGIMRVVPQVKKICEDSDLSFPIELEKCLKYM